MNKNEHSSLNNSETSLRGFSGYLLKKGALSKEELERALTTQKRERESLVGIIVKMGFIKEEILLNLLSGYLSVPPVRVLNLDIPKQILGLVPEKIARAYQVLPVGIIGNTLTLAMGDPLNVLAIDDIKKITKCEVNPIIAPFSQIAKAISNNYAHAPTETIEEIIKDQSVDALTIIKEGKRGVSQEEIFRSTKEAPVIKFTNAFLRRAVHDKTSDILIEPLENTSRVRLRIDGILRELETFSKKMHPFIVSRIKVLCNLNIAEHRLPQEGRFRSRILDRDVDFRVSILPSSLGEKVAIRILDKTAAILNLDFLGYEDDVLKKIKQDSLKAHGLLLACGPTGAGKTTALYSVINHIYSSEKNIVTVEDPIEYQLRGINQVSINPAIGLTFASGLRSILRQDPDIVMIGEIRDKETSGMAIKAALTGHLVLSTLHTTTSAGSVTRLVNMDIEPFLLSSTLLGVLAQRLVRVLCPKCKEKSNLADETRKKYSLENKIVIYKPKGCSFCQNIGYKGRVALSGYLQISPSIKKLINSCVSEGIIKKEARIEGMRTLREDGIIKVEKGLTTLEEVVRVTAADEDL